MITARSCLSVSLLLAIVTTTTVRDAGAREKPPAAKPAEVAPRGQREVKDITYGSWRKLCFKAGGAPTLCRTSITGTFPTGQVAVRVDLIEPDDGRNGRLQVFLPVGLYLQHPVKLSVDQGNSYHVPYTWCLSNTCIAADVADQKIIKDMEAGKELLLEMTDSNLLSLTTSVPLTQFVSTHKGAPAQTFEQDIDE